MTSNRLLNRGPSIHFVPIYQGEFYGCIEAGVFGVECELKALIHCPIYIPGATAYSNARYGQGTGPIVFSNLLCTGSETSILDCPSDGFGVIGSCTHADDASVACLECTLFFQTYSRTSEYV